MCVKIYYCVTIYWMVTGIEVKAVLGIESRLITLYLVTSEAGDRLCKRRQCVVLSGVTVLPLMCGAIVLDKASIKIVL